jgi:hypothetical protein
MDICFAWSVLYTSARKNFYSKAFHDFFFDAVSFLFRGSKHETVLSVLSELLAPVGGSIQSDRSTQTRLCFCEGLRPPQGTLGTENYCMCATTAVAIGVQRAWDYPFLSLLPQLSITEVVP